MFLTNATTFAINIKRDIKLIRAPITHLNTKLIDIAIELW